MRTIILTLIFTCMVCSTHCQVQRGSRPITEAETCLAVHVDDWGLFSRSPFSKLIVAIWGDGKIVWSKDNIKGGSPYFTGKVSPEQIEALISTITKESVFRDKDLRRAYFGPDSMFTVIEVRAGRHVLKMASWHEMEEAGGDMVATSSGVEPLNGKTVESVLNQEPKKYQKYRRIWTGLRQRISALVPAGGTPDKGDIDLHHGIMTWVEPANFAEKPK
jgi:hypothetical protein